MNIFVSNLNFKVKAEDLKSLFTPFGKVSSAKVITDKMSGRSRGFGFVEMDSDEDGQAAIADLHESEHQGRKISVQIARDREPNGNRA